jgi:hypothetical protein
MLLKWLPDCKKKSTELLRDTSLCQVMTSCDFDIDWGSNKEDMVDNKDNDEESDDNDSSLEIDDEEDSKDDDTAFNFNCPAQVSLCASLIVNFRNLHLFSCCYQSYLDMSDYQGYGLRDTIMSFGSIDKKDSALTTP